MKRKIGARNTRTTSLDKLTAYDGDDLSVVIETPKGSQNKFTFDTYGH